MRTIIICLIENKFRPDYILRCVLICIYLVTNVCFFCAPSSFVDATVGRRVHHRLATAIFFVGGIASASVRRSKNFERQYVAHPPLHPLPNLSNSIFFVIPQRGDIIWCG